MLDPVPLLVTELPQQLVGFEAALEVTLALYCHIYIAARTRQIEDFAKGFPEAFVIVDFDSEGPHNELNKHPKGARKQGRNRQAAQVVIADNFDQVQDRLVLLLAFGGVDQDEQGPEHPQDQVPPVDGPEQHVPHQHL